MKRNLAVLVSTVSLVGLAACEGAAPAPAYLGRQVSTW
jgi:hypothetical protein